MASVQKIETYDVPIEKFYEVIVDYESYPEFVDGMENVRIIKDTAKAFEVEYELNLIKTFRYVLTHKHKKNKEVSWKLKEGDLFKKSEGSWKLKKIDDSTTEVTYSLDVEMKLFAPKMIVKKLVNVQVPNTMQAYYERAKEI